MQFSENSQLVTVENQHFQKPSFEPSFGPGNSQLQTSNFNNNTFPNHFGNMPTRPNFQPQPQPPHLVPAQTFDGYPAQEFHPPQQGPPVNYNNSSNWTSAPHIVEAPQGQMYTSQQPLPLQGFPQQQPGPPQFCPPFPQNQPNFRPHQPAQYKARMRGSVLKRALPRKTPIVTSSPVKQMRFDHNKQKSPVVNTRSNLQEIKTVDNLPDTTTSQEPEPEIEEDEETKQYRKKIVEQKALREMILKQKEARRLASIKEKQKQGGPSKAIFTIYSIPLKIDKFYLYLQFAIYFLYFLSSIINITGLERQTYSSIYKIQNKMYKYRIVRCLLNFIFKCKRLNCTSFPNP